MKIKTNIEQSVIKTLAYYRALRTPLTLVQLGRYLISDTDEKYSLSEIAHGVKELVDKKIVVEQKGLYWLDTGGRAPKNTWLKFVRSEKTSQRKIGKALKAFKLFSLAPFLRALFICGSVARKVSHPGSDIDFLILTRPGRVWTVRFFLTVFAFLLGKKTNDAKMVRGGEYRLRGSRKDKFCLNHYRSSANLKLEEPLRDLYSAQEYAGMLNIYSGNRIDRKFFKKNKLWMKKFVSHFNFSKLPITESNDYSPAGLRRTLEKMLGGKIGHIIEKLLCRAQVKKISLSGGRLEAEQRVIAEEEVIMFHLNPRAPLALRKYEQITNNLLG